MLAYLAAPYSHKDPVVIELRMEVICRVDAALMKRGIYTVSPLLKHFIVKYEALPGDWAYWGDYSRELVSRCDTVIVICIEGWKESVGVQAEIELAMQLGKSIMYVDVVGDELLGFVP